MSSPIDSPTPGRRSEAQTVGPEPVRNPDSDDASKAFEDEYRRQSAIVAAANAADPDLDAFLEAALADFAEEW